MKHSSAAALIALLVFPHVTLAALPPGGGIPPIPVNPHGIIPPLNIPPISSINTALPADKAVNMAVQGATGALTHPVCVAETNRRAALSPPQPPPSGDFPCVVPASNGAGVVNGMCFATVCKGASFTGLDGLLSSIGTLAAIAGMAALVGKFVSSGSPTSAAAAAFPGGIASTSCAMYTFSPVSVPSPCVLSLGQPQFPGTGSLPIEQIIERARRISRDLQKNLKP